MQNVVFERDVLEGHPEGQADGIDFAAVFKTVLQAVRRNILLIGAILLGTIVAGVILTLLITPKYKANAQVLIENQADQIIEGSELQKIDAGSDTDLFLQTQLGIIRSRSLARIVIQSGGFDKRPEFFEALGTTMPDDDELKGPQLATARQTTAINVLLENLEVDLPRDSRIATITVTSRDSELAAKIANLYADRFIEYNLNQKYQSSAYARRFLGDQLSEARAKLTQSERDLNQYARAAGLIRVSSQGDSGTQETALSVTNNTLIQLNDAASKAVAERITAEDRWNTLARQPALSVPEVNSNQAIQQLVGEKTKIEGQLAEEQSRHLDDYSTVKSKRAQIAELDRRILTLAETLKKTAYLDYVTALEREKSLTAQVDTLRNAALGEQDRGVQYSVLKREADTNRALYETLLSRYNQISAMAGASNNNLTIVDRAEVPRIPASPKLVVNLVVSFILGLMFAAAAVFMREIFDDAIRTPDDVERKLNMRLLGLVPKVKEGEDIDEAITDHRSGVSEAYRSLVTNLRYSTATGLPQILCVTSSREGEGKSTTARTIARDIAGIGKRVLLVDMDLRRPTLHRKLTMPNASGLTDLLTGNKSFDDVLLRSEIDNLDLITGLPTPPDPALILSGEGVPAFLAQARERYEVVIIDSPPLLGLSDAVILATHADGVLFVIDGSAFHRGAVKSALRRLALINANILGVVLNRFEPRVGDDEYAYYAYNYYNYRSDGK